LAASHVEKNEFCRQLPIGATDVEVSLFEWRMLEHDGVSYVWVVCPPDAQIRALVQYTASDGTTITGSACPTMIH
jgi:hypothetical protein